MGWFLSKQTTKKKKKTTKRGAQANGWDPGRTLLGLKFAGLIAAVVAAAIAWHWGEQQLLAHARTHHAQEINADNVVFSSQPPGILPDAFNDLRAGVAARINADPTDGAGIRDAAHWLSEQHSKVKELRQLQRMPDGTIAVDLDFRYPAAIVQMENEESGTLDPSGYHLIDREGYQIDGTLWLKDVEHLGLPKILGVPSANRPTGIGSDAQWKGNTIPAAMSLIDVLRDNDLLEFVDAISVNNRDEIGRTRLVITVLVQPDGHNQPLPCRIIWGLPPNHPQAVIEPGVANKIAMLRELLLSDKFKMGYRPESWINSARIWFPPAIRPD